MEIGKQLLQVQTNSEPFGILQERRSANYKPNIWKYDFLQSLSSTYYEDQYKTQAEKLKKDVKHLFVEAVDLESKLELVDCIKKLGLASHFKDEIKKALDSISSSRNNNNCTLKVESNLYIAALCFRLLREHGYQVSQDMFVEYMDEMRTSFLKNKCLDLKGVVELFEASHLSIEGENILEEAKAFSTGILKSLNSSNVNIFSEQIEHVVHTLELPYHWRVQWFDVKWQINMYEKEKNKNKIILGLAKINFNVVQATLQSDLKEISRWWKNLGIIENLNFTRDRLVESFLCSVGLLFEPQYSSFRKWLTKVVIMILIIDDIYDVYGSLEELQLFTNAVHRWETREIERLPECMQICFQALDSITSEIAVEMQREKGWNQPLHHLKKVWADFCQALFVEAKWYNKGCTPSLEEYLNNGWISSSGTVLSVHSFFSIMNNEDMEDFLARNYDLFYNISVIIRLCNDLGTSVAEQERGDAASSIACLIKEKNVTEEAARKCIKKMVSNSWKKINEKWLIGQSDDEKVGLFVHINTNMARVVHNLYQYGDGFGVQDQKNKQQMLSLLVEPFKLH